MEIHAMSSLLRSRLAPLRFVSLCLVLLAAVPSTMAQPANDDFDNAIVVAEPLPFTSNVDTSSATVAADDPTIYNAATTVWYCYTPSATGYIQANTFGSDYDTIIGVFTGQRGSLNLVTSNDDSGSLQSRVNFLATAATTYWFMVGSWNGTPGGNLVFTVQQGQAPADVTLTINPTGSVTPKTGIATVGGTITTTSLIYVYEVDVFAKQRSGRGNIIASAFVPINAEVDTSWDWSAQLQDPNGGLFVGGKANVSATLFYLDLGTGEFQVVTTEQVVQLKGGKGGKGG
jgi:hypothetical protein